MLSKMKQELIVEILDRSGDVPLSEIKTYTNSRSLERALNYLEEYKILHRRKSFRDKRITVVENTLVGDVLGMILRRFTEKDIND